MTATKLKELEVNTLRGDLAPSGGAPNVVLAEGSNPVSLDAIVYLGNRSWLVAPEQEYPEGTRIGKYHFRLDVCFENPSPYPELIELTVRWPHEPALLWAYLDYVFLKHPDDSLHQISGRVREESVDFSLMLPPGRTWVSSNPAWHCLHQTIWQRSVRRASVCSIGLTDHGRSIDELVFGKSNRPAVAVVARMHPYESASSYCVAGLAEWLDGDSPEAREILERYRVHLIPIANPDGVAEGCTRLTRRDGVDLNIDAFDRPDATAEAIRHWIDELKPAVFLNFHNWMAKNSNGMFHASDELMWRFLRHFDAMLWHGRTWYCADMRAVASAEGRRQVFDHYAREQYGSQGLLLEFPWYDWTPNLLSLSAVKSLQSLIKSA